MKTQAAISLFLASVFIPLHSIAADKHVHGEAELFIAIESNQILIEMESPAANILGFEHEPNTARQKITLRDSLATLQNYKSLIETTNGECQQVDAFVESPFTSSTKAHKEESGHNEHNSHSDHNDHNDHHEHNTDKHDHGGNHKDEEAHSQFHVTYTLKCKNSSAVKALTLTVFDTFPRVKMMQVNWVTTTGQGSQKANPKKVNINIRN